MFDRLETRQHIRVICAILGLFVISLQLKSDSRVAQEKPGVAHVVKVTEGTNIAATVAPDRSAVVMDLQGSLWSVPFKGGVAKRLTDPFLEAARPDL